MDGRWYRARLEKVIRCRIVRVSQRFPLPIQPHPLKPFYVKDAAGNVCGFWKLHGSFSTQAEKTVLQGGNITFLSSSNVNLLFVLILLQFLRLPAIALPVTLMVTENKLNLHLDKTMSSA